MSFKFRRDAPRVAVVASLAVIALAVGASSASGVGPPRVRPPEGGPPISCQSGGDSSSGYSIHDSPICLSFRSAFYVYDPHFVCNQYNYGYTAYIYAQPYTLRWQSNFCMDGVWHFSSSWGSNENRHSEERVFSSSQGWGIIQYKL